MKRILALNSLMVALAAASLSCFAGCEGAEAPGKATTKLACASILAPEVTPVTLEVFTGGPGPTLKPQALPFVVTLAPTVADGYWSGHGQVQIDSALTYGLYVAPGVTFAVRDSAGNLKPFSGRYGSPTTCDKIDLYGFIQLNPGTYSLELGPAPTSSLRMLLIPSAAEDKL
jgi:hypothetical protein